MCEMLSEHIYADVISDPDRRTVNKLSDLHKLFPQNQFRRDKIESNRNSKTH